MAVFSMSGIFKMFKDSANELKSVRCLVTTGILISLYVILNMFLAIKTPNLFITFGYLALAIIGMLYGPVVAMIAAIPCDIIPALFNPYPINFFITPARIVEGLIYGLLLYRLVLWGKSIKDIKSIQAVKVIISRFLVMTICYLAYISLVNYYVIGGNSDAFIVYLIPRIIKNVIQFPIDLLIMFILLPTVNIFYRKAIHGLTKERRTKY